MKFTFGICSNPQTEEDVDRLMEIIDSIFNQQIPEYEILVIGGKFPNGDIIDNDENKVIGRTIEFDESVKPKAWITRKKNILVQEAKYENIVLMHDYMFLHPDWYKGWKEFGEDFDVGMNRVLNMEGTRHSDWIVNMFDVWKLHPEWDWNMWDTLLPYETQGLTKIQYISGGYWVAKKKFMLENPLDESLLWGEKEDIEWSERVRQKTTFKMNKNSTVQIMKPNKWAPNIIDDVILKEVMEANGL